MIIDFHTHIFPDKLAPKVIDKLQGTACCTAYVDGTLNGLLNSMETGNIDKSVSLPVASSQSQVVSCNNFSKKVNDTYDDKIISFGAMHPDFEDYKVELSRIKEMGIKGIKLHPDYQGVFFDDIRYMNIIDCAESLDLITIVHAGVDIGLPDPVHASPKHIKNLISTVNPQKLVLAHMGGFNLWRDVIDTLGGENLYLDTSFSLGKVNYFDDFSGTKIEMMGEELFMEAINTFGEDKFLFASDSPWGGQKETFEEIQKLPLSEIQKEKILSGNAVKLLGL